MTARTILAFDFGTKSIGSAIGQEVTGTANPLKAFKAKEGIPNWDDIEKQINAKNQLINELAPHVGRIDGAGLDSAAVATKAAEILGLACDSGHELATVRGYLHAAKGVKSTVDHGTAQDAAASKSALSKLDEAGL